LDKIDFSVKGPFGNMGPKLKHEMQLAKFQFIKNVSGREPETLEEKEENKINPYYSIEKVPGQ
jgi:hypothetical protein